MIPFSTLTEVEVSYMQDLGNAYRDYDSKSGIGNSNKNLKLAEAIQLFLSRLDNDFSNTSKQILLIQELEKDLIEFERILVGASQLKTSDAAVIIQRVRETLGIN